MLLLFYDVIFPDYKRMAKKKVGIERNVKNGRVYQDGRGLRHEAHLLPQKH